MNTKLKRETKQWLSLFLLLLLLFGISCNDNDSECTVNEEIENLNLNCPVSPVCGRKDDIVGKWKLVKATEAWGMNPQTTDHSCDHIIYEFRKDGKLVITSDIEGELEGEYSYTYIEYRSDVDFEYNAQIDGAKCVFSVKKQLLEIYVTQGAILGSEFQKYRRLLTRVKY